jgi:hypothetical protein
MSAPIRWPDGKDFAFTIFDDTDLQTIDNAPPVYAFLAERGFRVTKSVWPITGAREPLVGGATCDEPGYLAWVRELQRQGFEIGLHNVTYHTSEREQTRRGIERFQALFGHPPRVLANHTGCDEALYWGGDRLSGVNALLYELLTRFRYRGDLCRDNVTYVRNFVFGDIDTLAACPFMPYHDPSRPYVKYWFASTEGPTAESFVRTICESNQDRLEASGGACIMYTHLGKGFYEGGRLHEGFRTLMDRLSRKNGWFVPVSTLLDFLRQTRGEHEITPRERARLERRWLWHKIRIGGCS